MNKNLFLLPIVCSIIFLSGCWDLNESERMYYIHSLAIDYIDGEYEVYMQLISFGNVAKSEQLNQDIIQSEVSSEKGKTVDEAFFKLYHAIDERIFWGHLSFIVLSEEALKNNRINSLLNLLTRYRETRYQTWVYCTDEPLNEFLKIVPLLKRSITLSKLADPLNSYEQESFIEPMNLRQLLIQINEPSYEAKIPYVKLKDDWETQKGSNKSVKVAGVGIISRENYKGSILEDSAHGIKWLTNKTARGPITSRLDDSQYITAAVEDLKVKVKPIVEGNNVRFDINLTLTVGLNSFSSKLTVTEIKKAITKEVQKEIKDTFKKGLKLNVDIYRLSEVLYRDNVKVWKKLQKDGKIELTENSIRNINVAVEKVATGRKSFEPVVE
ncbi:Ger(x)C family spore germination protein [Lysinibacillus antri]|uniref:Ger(X)C family spore germination protein n=1 Tax=Lysinibacillus antri TaxID=2498145 RepID=A0A3S0PQC7_9BACI|nr:Ger(x)C family spore germination protein [Lysinibacillus antri]RUL54011.1 Ger(x)C family spore germination protein [Lysinibacillus antri]